MKIAVFPGSFDPITKGHEAVLRAALPLFDKIYIAIGVNADKTGMFSIQQRKEWIRQCFSNENNVEIIDYNGLTIELCRKLQARFIIRGIRNPLDFQYERDIAQANKQLNPNVETVFFVTDGRYAHISSSIVRDVYRHHGDCSDFIPENVDFPENN